MYMKFTYITKTLKFKLE